MMIVLVTAKDSQGEQRNISYSHFFMNIYHGCEMRTAQLLSCKRFPEQYGHFVFPTYLRTIKYVDRRL